MNNNHINGASNPFDMILPCIPNGNEEENEARAKALTISGFTVVCHNGLRNPPEWLLPLGLGTAGCTLAYPFVKRQLSQLIPAMSLPSSQSHEPQAVLPPPPNLPLISSPAPTKISFVITPPSSNTHNIDDTEIDTLNREINATLERVKQEIGNALEYIGNTPLFKEVTGDSPETSILTNFRTKYSLDSIPKSKLREHTRKFIQSSLEKILSYIENMEPIFKIQLQLHSLKSQITEQFQGLSRNEINRAQLQNSTKALSRTIHRLQEALSGLQNKDAETTPAFDFEDLGLSTTKALIRIVALPQQIQTEANVTELHNPYQKALDIVQQLYDLKIQSDALARDPSSRKLLAVVTLLQGLDANIEGLTTETNAPLSPTVIGPIVQEYKTFIVKILIQAAKTTTQETTSLLNVPKSCKVAQDRHTFLKQLQSMLILEANQSTLLTEALDALQNAIASKQAWKPFTDSVYLVSSTLAIATVVTGVRLAVDAFFPKR